MRRLVLAITLVSFLHISFAQQQDTISNDTVTPTQSKKQAEPLEQLINYQAEDSIRFYLDSMITYMYDKVDLTSENMELKAGKVRVDLRNNEIYAYTTFDSLTRERQRPVFTDGNDQFVATFMKYNFKTRKGYARNVKTERTEGFLHGEQVKIYPSGETNILHGKFTTCELDHPHYYINMTKAKYIPNKNIVSGPFYFVIEDIPLYFIGLPFGYFPQKKHSSSGIIQPMYYREELRGFGLRDFGYYFAVNDYMDLKVLGSIYSKGSWGVKVISRMVKRYKFNANFSFGYEHIVTEEPFLLETPPKNTFNIKFSYRQSPKANPTSNFSANIDFYKGNYRQFNAMDINTFTNNTATSSISFSKRFRGTPFNMSLNMNISQNLSDSTINSRNLPSLNLNMNTITPFAFVTPYKRDFWDNIKFNFRMRFVNSLMRKIKDTLLYTRPDLLLKYMNLGIAYQAPLTASFKVFRYLTFSTGFDYRGYIYFRENRKILMGYDEKGNPVVYQDTIFSIRHYMDYNLNAAFSTKLYGIFNIKAFGIKAIRHTISPSIGFRYKPEFGASKWRYFFLDPRDTTGRLIYTAAFNPTLGYPSPELQHSLTFALNNMFEVKAYRRKADTTLPKSKREYIVPIKPQIKISGDYNFALDSLNLSKISVWAQAGTKFFSLTYNATFDPYTIDKAGNRINKFEYEVNGRLARFEKMTLIISSNLNSNMFKAKSNQQKAKDQKKEYIPYSYFDPNWSLNLRYSMTLINSYIATKQIFQISANQVVNVSFSVQPTPYWNVMLITGYDFTRNRLTSTTVNLYRDLHCWEMVLQITPFGRMRSYFFTIRNKSPMFSFLQFKRQRSWHDNLL